MKFLKKISNLFKILKNKLTQYWQELALIFIVLPIFFILTSSYNFFVQGDDFIKWGSPDETANYIFSKLYAETGDLEIFEEYNLYAKDIIRPRSFRSDHGIVRPMSFLGIVLVYGKIASLTNYKIIPYLTPFFACLGIFFYYLLIKRIFGRRNAFISAIILSVFPVYIYYTARSMFHNVLFIVFLIIGLYYLIAGIQTKKKEKPQTQIKVQNKKSKKRIFKRIAQFFLAQFFRFCIFLKNNFWKWILFGLGGFFIGLAVITRSSELLWLLPLFLILWIFNLRKMGLFGLTIFCLAVYLAVLPVLHWNNILYGAPLHSGYPEMNRSIANIFNASQDLFFSFGKLISSQEDYQSSIPEIETPGNKLILLNTDLSLERSLIEKIKDNVFHFGFSPKKSFQMFYYYFVLMFYWLFWPAILGLFIFLSDFRLWGRKEFSYIISFFVISFVLVLYYGSWDFHDNPDPNSFTIGNSYTRYWLPIYLYAIPLVSLFLFRFFNGFFARFFDRNAGEQNLEKSRKYYLRFMKERLRKIFFRTPILSEKMRDFREKIKKYFKKNIFSILEIKILFNFKKIILKIYRFLKNIFKFILNNFLLKKSRKSIFVNASISLVVFVFIILSIFSVVFGSEEGLVYAVYKNQSARDEYQKVLDLTESNSVIITFYHDKIFFPERKVVRGLFNNNEMNAIYAKLTKLLPVYYYNFSFNKEDFNYLNQRRLREFGLQIREVQQVNQDFTLYRLERLYY